MLDDYRISQISADRVTLTGAKGDIVLRPAYDGTRGGGGPGEMGQPGFQPPGFQPPGFNPGFRPPGFPGMQPPPPPAPPNASDDDNGDDATPAQPVAPQPFPGFRGPFIPRGRITNEDIMARGGAAADGAAAFGQLRASRGRAAGGAAAAQAAGRGCGGWPTRASAGR